MARYIKANPLVAKYLNLQNDRNTVKDGNYILWQSDLLSFGPLIRLSETLVSIGAIALMPHEAREEQDGVNLRPLPKATDPRFIILESVAEGISSEAVEVPGTTGANAPEAPGPGEEENNENITTNEATV